MIKNKYEISLWKDFLGEPYFLQYGIYVKDKDSGLSLIQEKAKYGLKNEKEEFYITYSGQEIIDDLLSETPTLEGNTWYPQLSHYFDEEKIAIIGSDTMTTQCRALEPKLVEGQNGTNTFTFKMYYNYIDTETGEETVNPFINLLTNERKVKVFWKNKWYDFVIKNIQENSDQRSAIYTCKDLFINELSKNGFNLEFDNELKNNQGSVEVLAGKVLKGSDWSVGDCELIKQYTEEPVYEVRTTQPISEFSIPANSPVLLFYSSVQEDENFIQFLWNNDSEEFNTENETSQLVINATECSLEGDNIVATYFNYEEGMNVSDRYRGRRPVRSQKQIFEPFLDRNVKVYSDKDGKEYYGYTATSYKDSTVVNNLITNNKLFASTTGWTGVDDALLVFEYQPIKKINGDIDTTVFGKSYLKINGTYKNNGLQTNGIYLPDNGFQVEQKYVYRYKVHPANNWETLETLDFIITNIEFDKEKSEDYPTYKTEYKTEDGTEVEVRVEEWYENILICKEPVTKAEIYAGIKPEFQITSNGEQYLEEIEFFPFLENEEGDRINPGDMSKDGIVFVENRYYDPTKNIDCESEKDVKFAYTGKEKWTEVEPVYIDTYEKIRGLTAKQSNRFNLLQTLAETFECWCKFEIKHDYDTGKILRDETTGRQEKYVCFVERLGEDKGVGFVYGIDLKTIQRTINSDQITTKVIVLPNNNEFAQNGFCTIQRSEENYSRENFILNFDYYINQGLLERSVLNRDLYSSTGEGLGYYYNLNLWNKDYDALGEKLIYKKEALSKQESYYKVYEETISALEEELTSLTASICQLLSRTLEKDVDDITDIISLYKTEELQKVEKAYTDYRTYELQKEALKQYEDQKKELENSITSLKKEITKIKNDQKQLKDNIEELHTNFYNKYSRFIQEGSWNSEEYIDDNFYYLDAKSVAYTSSRPQVQYSVSVVRLSELEEFKGKTFNVGDISFIEDPKFFGYVFTNQVKTPYREKVIISEVTSNFDNPEKDGFKVQNYKTQFEDLFQRIASTTQTLQYASGEYARAANIVNSDGTIKIETLQSSLAMNQELVYSAQNDTIHQDPTGLTVRDLSNPNKVTKLTSGGLFISTDGGLNWKNAVRGEGVSTQYLTAGNINTSNIVILDGNFTNFRWDKVGINAFSPLKDGGINLNQFVRFDHFGIYGVSTNEGDDFAPTDEDTIWEKAKYALTWKGFMLKNRYGDGYVAITSEDDIVVNDGERNRVKIGNIGTLSEPIYGMQLKDATGAITMETDDSGSLWLKNKLNVETYSINNTVGIGKLDTDTTKDSDHGGRVIDANKAFVVYEDGHVIANSGSFKGHIEATSGSFTGTVTATGGQIGGLTIEQIENGIIQAFISGPTTITNNNPSILKLEAHLEGAVPTGYEWYKNDEFISTALESIYEIDSSKITDGDYFYVKISYTDDGKSQSQNFYITKTDIEVDNFTYEIVTSHEVILKDGEDNFKISPNIFTFYLKRDGEIQNNNNYQYRLYNVGFNNGLIELEDVEEFIGHDDNNEKYILNLELYGQKTYIEDNSEEKDVINYNSFLYEKDSALKIEFLEKGIVKAIKIIPVQYKQNDDLARFSINARDITAAIGASKLSFSENGLEIKNSGFSVDNGNQNVLSFETIYRLIDDIKQFEEHKIYYELIDEEYTITSDIEPIDGKKYYEQDSELVIVGRLSAATGSFSGDISAATGTFTGGIHATQGTIGGFNIDSDRLFSTAVNEEGLPLLELNGKEGKIIANVISLGIGAEIVDYIQLGNAKIQNPSLHEGVFIDAQNIKITDDGVIKLGNFLTLNGADEDFGNKPTIKSGNYWSITPYQATFNNIVANGGTIKNVVFEQQSTQAVGGVMIFKESSNITVQEGDGYSAIIENVKGFKEGDWVYVPVLDGMDSTLQINTLDEESGMATFSGPLKDATSIVKLVSKNKNDLLIAMNPIIAETEADQVKINNITLPGGGLSFIQIQDDGTKLNVTETPVLFMGKLESIAKSGYGLFGDNVYLNGTLTTKVGEGSQYTYAGVNTTSNVISNENGANDGGYITFWAGALGEDDSSIQKAPFQVTDKGNLFSQNGIFKGSIISDSIIQGADVYALRLHGGYQNSPAELSIYDTSKGIVFRENFNIDRKDNEGNLIEGPEIFRINKEGFSFNGNNKFISINDEDVDFFGNIAAFNVLNINAVDKGLLSINPEGIKWSQPTDTGSNDLSIIDFVSNGINLLGETFKLSTTSIELSENATFKKDIIFDNDTYKMEYKNEGAGYNLYVSNS